RFDAGQGPRPLLPRRRAHDGRLLPRAADLQRAAVQMRYLGLSRDDAHLWRMHENRGFRLRAILEAARRGVKGAPMPITGYRRPAAGTQPEHLFPRYASTVKRAPTQPLITMPATPTELSGPVFGYGEVKRSDHDLTKQHAGEPIGERIVVSGRVLDENGRP